MASVQDSLSSSVLSFLRVGLSRKIYGRVPPGTENVNSTEFVLVYFKFVKIPHTF